MAPSALFAARKARILAEINDPGPDASPKGFIDIQIVPLMDRLNSHEGVVTTSSCSGRISVFLEGVKKERRSDRGDEQEENGLRESAGNAGIGGKGDGGKWLFVSHDPVEVCGETAENVSKMLFGVDSGKEEQVGNHNTAGLGLGSREEEGEEEEELDIRSKTRFVHFKFEPMILHIQTSDLSTSQILLNCALSSGFRESGIMNPGLSASSFPMLAIRCNGLFMDSIIGIYDTDTGIIKKLVDAEYMKTLVKISNLRFDENGRRIKAFSDKVEELLFPCTWTSGLNEEGGGGGGAVWEDKETRKARKKCEGLRKRQELRAKGAFAGDRTGMGNLESAETELSLLGEWN